MSPSARKKIQRGSRRFEAPCSESNSQPMMDAGVHAMMDGHYIGAILAERQFSDGPT